MNCKKLLSVVLPVILVTGFFESVSFAEISYDAFTESSMLSVFRDKEFTGKTKTIELSLAKDEYEPAQIVIIPKGKEDLKGIKIEFSDLTYALPGNDEGDVFKISKDNIEYHPAAWVNVDSEYGMLKAKENNKWYEEQRQKFLAARHLKQMEDVIGFRPDPLRLDRVFDAHPGKNNIVWLTFYVPKDAVAGTYTGTVSIIPKNGKRTEVNVSLKVWDFVLLKECPLGLVPWSDSGSAAKATGIPDFEYKKMLAKHMVKLHRGNSYFTWSPSPEGSYDTFDKQTEELIQLGMNKFWIFIDMRYFYPDGPLRVKNNDERMGPERQAILKKLYKHLKEKGWLDNFILYTWDEPDFLKPGILDKWQKSQQEIKDAGFTNWLSDFTGRAKGVFNQMIGYTGIWVAHMGLWESDDNVSFLLERKKAGDRIGWYWGANTIAPGYMMYHLLIEQRNIFWLAYKYNIDFFTIWNYDYGFRGLDYNAPNIYWKTPEETFPASVMKSNRNYIHPNPVLDKNNPFLGSMREEVLRDGREDYCYLYMLGKLIEKQKKEGNAQLAKEGEVALAKSMDMVAKSMTEYSTTPSDIYLAKKTVAEAILKLSNKR
ncbi:MAG: hypothetical protein PHE88_11255 [Elusimicrobia bacterium]|nr:hypothetical protein [Elusimicrobiota bacterium]